MGYRRPPGAGTESRLPRRRERALLVLHAGLRTWGRKTGQGSIPGRQRPFLTPNSGLLVKDHPGHVWACGFLPSSLQVHGLEFRVSLLWYQEHLEANLGLDLSCACPFKQGC